ncbi:dynamin family protein [Peribacillus kribbensis]|uniref:dynamin family protein n=1 Tax=Peribacillus kribbensis TaxID=356658 RepID=UPI000421AA01|nr:dynamin family protein [Peribacillus kribbensis]
MNQKQTYVQTVMEIKEIAVNHHLPEEIPASLDKLASEMESFTVKMPIVGGFNAGKSTLINSFLETELLPVEITPETAIAAEIKYGENKIVAHKQTGETQIFPLEKIKEIDATTFRFIEVYLENEKIRALGDVTLVDMPGFDSGIKEHNKAIFQYLKEGIVFLIVVDSEDGSIKSSVLNFLYELDLYQLNYAVIVNKIDQRTKAEMGKVVDNVKSVVDGISKGVMVETASDRIENGNAGFLKAIQSFQKDDLFKKRFLPELLQFIARVKLNLDVIVRNSDVDTDEITARIHEIEAKIKGLTNKFKQEETQITHRIRNVVKENILSDVQNVLMNESNSLALSAKAGETSFNQKINELVRPVLICSTNQHLELTFSDLVASMSTELLDANQIAQGINVSSQKVGAAIELVQEGLNKLAENAEFMKRFEKIYKVSVGGLAIITGVVAPWVELIIFFLPDILKVLGIGSEERQLEKLKEQVETQIIPQITNKIRGNIEDNLENVKNEFLQKFKQEMEEEMLSLSSALHQSINSKEKKESELAEYLNQLKSDIQRLESIRQNLA